MRAMADLGRAFVAAIGIAYAGYVSLGGVVARPVLEVVRYTQGAQSAAGDTVGGTEPFLEWAIRQGGALAVLIIVLFFYRRDYKQLSDFWKEQNMVTVNMVQAATKSQADMAAALRENTSVVHSAKNVLQQFVAVQEDRRRDDDDDNGRRQRR